VSGAAAVIIGGAAFVVWGAVAVGVAMLIGEMVDVLRHLTPTGYRSATWAAGCLTVRFPQAVAS
jgi:hypothetical protein